MTLFWRIQPIQVQGKKERVETERNWAEVSTIKEDTTNRKRRK